MLRYGDKGNAVTELQIVLKNRAFEIVVDGYFGEKTKQAVMEFQRQTGLVVDGIVGEKTKNALKQRWLEKYLKESDLKEVAQILGVDVARIKAVNKIESAGTGFLENGLVKILFERHIFYREIKKKFGQKQADIYSQQYQQICSIKPGGYRGGVYECRRLDIAYSLDPECALKSASWGLFQIMGFNHKLAGFEDVFSFVENQKMNERNQLLAFVNLIKNTPSLYQALKNRNWTEFAQQYNGKNYHINAYDLKLRRAYELFKKEGV